MPHSSRILTVGDTVRFRACDVIVERIEVVVEPGDKYGVPVASVPWSALDRAVVDLSSGYFAYGDQLQEAV